MTFKEEIEKNLKSIASALKPLPRQLGGSLRRGLIGLRNWWRRRRKRKLDYLIFTLNGAISQRDGTPRPLWQRMLPYPDLPLSLERLNFRLRRVAEADNVRGVVVILQQLEGNLATLQNLRRSLARLRDAGKEVIIYTPQLDLPHYFVAAAADKIIAAPTATFDVLGLYNAVVFLKDTLEIAGISLDIINISPYKSAMDQLGRSDMSPELREQLSWLMDDQYDQITAGIAAGRNLPQKEVKVLIDNAPYHEQEIIDKKLVDALLYEDEMPAFLGTKEQPAKLTPWKKGRKWLSEQYKPVAKKAIGVVTLSGAIRMGKSRKPPIDIPIPIVGGESAGEQTVVEALRLAEKMPNLAGLIFYVDSPGGSALASDLIARQISRIAGKIPILAYMGDVAASGGYYVSAPCQKIMAQSGTITGSIGVISGRPNTVGLMAKLQANETALFQGKRAGIYRRNAPLNEDERAILTTGIQTVYRQFKQIVSTGRNLSYDELDPICNGRVWTGSQAQTYGLVDFQGDFVDAVQQIAKMGELPYQTHRLPIVNIFAKGKGLVLPEIAEMPAEWLNIFTGKQITELFNGQPLTLMPFQIGD